MAPNYKLTYFNARGIAEPIRLIFAYAGVKYEDVRMEKADWPALKPSSPMGKVPYLEVDGKKVHQSLAICRYLANEFKLNGDSAWDALQVDIIVDTIGDLKTQSMEYLRMLHTLQHHDGSTVDEVKKEEKKEVLLKQTLPFYMSKFEAIVKENGGFFVNGKITWADIFWACMIDNMITCLEEDVLKDYPSLTALKIRVLSHPGIKSWIDTRPKTAM